MTSINKLLKITNSAIGIATKQLPTMQKAATSRMTNTSKLLTGTSECLAANNKAQINIAKKIIVPDASCLRK